MFAFGKAEDTAALYMGASLAKSGPGVPECHYDEMSRNELKVLFAYTYDAFRTALRDGADKEVLDYINSEYDEVFQAVVDADPSFAERIRSGKHRFLPDHSEETVLKYQMMAGLLDP